jgi:hypothetical protein
LEPPQEHRSTNRFIRVSGFLFFLFGLLAVVLRIIQFLVLGDPPLQELALSKGFLILQGIPSLLAAIFFLSGCNALHLRQADRVGLAGLVAYLLAFSAMVLSAGAMWTYAVTAPFLAREAPELLTSASSGIIRAVLASMALGQVGWLLLALVSLRAKVIPQWALLLAVGSIALVLVLTPFAQTQLLRLIYNVLVGAGPLAVGYVLWRTRWLEAMTADGRSCRVPSGAAPPVSR